MHLPKDFIQYAKEWEEKIGAFIEFKLKDGEETSLQNGAGGSQGGLSGLPFAVKDNIAVKNMSFSCGSRHLEKLRSPYSAAAVQKLEAAGGVVIGKTNLDEFGMGCSTENSAFGKTLNPWAAPDASPPADGAAAAVAAGIAPYALATDAGGSVRQPAASCGIAGLKPTYGAVSRYGLAAYASGLETIGVFADSVDRCRAVFAAIRGGDPLDQSSRDAPEAAPPLSPGGNPGAKRIGVLSPAAMAELCAPDEAAFRDFELAKERLASLGHTLADITIPFLKYAAPAWLAIAAADASCNLARFDGIRYGARPAFAENHDELMDRARETGFGPEAKLQILLGTLVLRSGCQDLYYLPAQRIRAGIKAGLEALLGDSEYRRKAEFDAILTPVFPAGEAGPADTQAARKSAVLRCADLAGLPALSVPVFADGGLPSGVQLIGRAFAEGTLFEIAKTYEEKFPFPHPKGYKAFWN